MPTLCKPAVSVPEYTITLEQTLEFAEATHAGKPQLLRGLRPWDSKKSCRAVSY